MSDPSQTLLAMARDRPDPKIVGDWLTAYLGKRPLDARRAVLVALSTTFSKPAVVTKSQHIGSSPGSGVIDRITFISLNSPLRAAGSL